jgi:hypothetical protein
MPTSLSEQLKNYISEGQKDLIDEGVHLLEQAEVNKKPVLNDYSYIVFPFAKAYEGFLKQVFLNAGYITRRDYYSQHFRIGKVLSPNLVRRLGRESVYKKICDESGCEISERMWQTWKKGRNEVFHYFPHNLHSIRLEEARLIITDIIATMELVVEKVKTKNVQDQLLRYDILSS